MMPADVTELQQGTEPAVSTSPPVRRRPAPARRKRRRWVGWARWIVALLLLGGGLAGWDIWSRRQQAVAKAAANAVEIVAVQRGTIEKSVEASGGVKANTEVDIKCRASGEIVKLPFGVSDRVKKGDLICQLDPTDEMLQVREAETTVLQSKAKFEQAKDDLEQGKLNLVTTRRKDESNLVYMKVRAANLRLKADRQRQLVDQKLGSPEDLETAETEAASAEADRAAAQVAIDELDQQAISLQSKEQEVAMADAQLQADQVRLDTEKQLLAYTTVTSPMDGVVTKLSVQRGTIVASGTDAINGGTAILTLSDLSELFISAKVDESDIGGVKLGQDVRIAVSAFPNRTFNGKVVLIAPKGEVNSNIVTFEVTVEVVDQDKNLLMPEMTGNTTIVEQRRENVLTLPSAAVIVQKGAAHVTMADGTRRDITIGLRTADSVEIVSGLKEGDRVRVGDAELPTRWKNPDDDAF